MLIVIGDPNFSLIMFAISSTVIALPKPRLMISPVAFSCKPAKSRPSIASAIYNGSRFCVPEDGITTSLPIRQFFIIFGIQILSAQNKSVNTLLETCGVLSAQGVYITYTSIGTLADAYTYGVYDDEFTTEILSAYVSLSEAVNEQLNVLLKTGSLHSDDIGFVIELNNIYELLISEADAYNKFVITKNESYLHIYDDSRLKAWDKIAILLGLE